MKFEEFLHEADFILGEGSLYERLRRYPGIEFDPYLAHASLLYDAKSARVLEDTHREYLDIGQRYQIPMIAGTSTWRANRERIGQSGYRDNNVNQDHVYFMQALRSSYGDTLPIFISGIIGPKGDAYRPEQALLADEAETFHAYQIETLAEAGVDCLMALTLPAISEAYGIARAMGATGLPYILSFVIRRDGTVLDGTPLHQAIEHIDSSVSSPPVGYFVNCVHPTVLLEGLMNDDMSERGLSKRLIGFHANTSRKRPEELDGLEELETEEPESLADHMMDLHEQFRIPILGGCCGTSTDHIEWLARTQARTA